MRRLIWWWMLGVLGLALGCQLMVEGDPGKLQYSGKLHELCKDVTCSADTHCELVPVVCSNGPCDAKPECVPNTLIDGFADETGSERASGQACGKATCAEGLVCCNASCGICTEPSGACIQRFCEDEAPTEPQPDASAASSCALVLCAPGTFCDDLGGQARCIPLPSCTETRCEAGTHCELVDVTCIRAPCPPQPSCVEDVNPCAATSCLRGMACQVVDGVGKCVADVCSNPCLALKCSGGTHCEAQEVQCVKEPCCAVGVCVANEKAETPCGQNTCGAGMYCCNASCGICTPKGGFCTQQVCDAVK